jgi:hypothetical protein
MCGRSRRPRNFESSRLDERTMLHTGCGASALPHPVRGETRYTLSRASGVPESRPVREEGEDLVRIVAPIRTRRTTRPTVKGNPNFPVAFLW